LSYTAVQPLPVIAEKPAAAPQVVPAPAPAAKSDTATSKDSNPEDKAKALKDAVQEIQKFVQSVRRNLEFSIDETSGEVVVKVIASETGEVVRQLPSAEAMKIADSLQSARSLLFDAKV
jgi:flagellar protein FlaG